MYLKLHFKLKVKSKTEKNRQKKCRRFEPGRVGLRHVGGLELVVRQLRAEWRQWRVHSTKEKETTKTNLNPEKTCLVIPLCTIVIKLLLTKETNKKVNKIK